MAVASSSAGSDTSLSVHPPHEEEEKEDRVNPGWGVGGVGCRYGQWVRVILVCVSECIFCRLLRESCARVVHLK